jgi:hypothetical protein
VERHRQRDQVRLIGSSQFWQFTSRMDQGLLIACILDDCPGSDVYQLFVVASESLSARQAGGATMVDWQDYERSSHSSYEAGLWGKGRQPGMGDPSRTDDVSVSIDRRTSPTETQDRGLCSSANIKLKQIAKLSPST